MLMEKVMETPGFRIPLFFPFPSPFCFYIAAPLCKLSAKTGYWCQLNSPSPSPLLCQNVCHLKLEVLFNVLAMLV